MFSIVQQKCGNPLGMLYARVFKRVCRICALVAAALILPVLAYAGTDNGEGNNGQNNGQQNGHHKDPPAVPEVNPVWILLPVSGVVMLLSWRRLSRAKT
jgi:hypothetical protein